MSLRETLLSTEAQSISQAPVSPHVWANHVFHNFAIGVGSGWAYNPSNEPV